MVDKAKVAEFMQRIQDRRDGDLVSYSKKLRHRTLHQEELISAEQLAIIYNFLLTNQDLEQKLNSLVPMADQLTKESQIILPKKNYMAKNEAASLPSIRFDKKNYPELPFAIDIIIDKHGDLELIALTGQKISTKQKKLFKKSKGQFKQMVPCFRIDTSEPKNKAKLQLELGHAIPLPHNSSIWEGLKGGLNRTVDRDEARAVGHIIKNLRPALQESIISSSIPDCKYIDFLEVGSLYQHGLTERKGVDKPTIGLNLYSDLALGSLGQVSADKLNLNIISNIIDGLIVIHAAGIIHGDIKPDNILLDEDEDGQFAKISDFGSAMFANDPNINFGKAQIGTPPFWPPEYFDDNITPSGKNDMWALGISIFYMLTDGKLPYFKPEHADDERFSGKELTSAIIKANPILAALLATDPTKRASATEAKTIWLQSPDLVMPPTQKITQTTTSMYNMMLNKFKDVGLNQEIIKDFEETITAITNLSSHQDSRMVGEKATRDQTDESNSGLEVLIDKLNDLYTTCPTLTWMRLPKNTKEQIQKIRSEHRIYSDHDNLNKKNKR